MTVTKYKYKWKNSNVNECQADNIGQVYYFLPSPPLVSSEEGLGGLLSFPSTLYPNLADITWRILAPRGTR